MSQAHLFAIGVLLAWLAGIRVYFTVFGIGIAGMLGWLDLPPALEPAASPWVVGVSGGMVAAGNRVRGRAAFQGGPPLPMWPETPPQPARDGIAPTHDRWCAALCAGQPAACAAVSGPSSVRRRAGPTAI